MASRQRTATAAALGGALLLLLSAAVCAEDAGSYPDKPIVMIVPFAPGGASDFVARMIQPGVSQILGQQVVVDNRPSAAGIVGTEVAARATPDGYTVFLGNIGTISINPGVYANLRIKPDKDLAPVSICADTPSVLITRLDFPANSVGELVAYVKANQGKVTFASPGSSTLNRLEMEVFKKDAGLDMVHVPYKGGAGPATMDVFGGHVDLMFTTLPSAMEFVRNRKVKALAVTTRARMEESGDLVLAGRAGARGDTAADHRQAARRDRQGARRTGDSGAHAQERRDPGQQQVTGRLQGLYGHRDRQVDQGDRGQRRARGLSRRGNAAGD